MLTVILKTVIEIVLRYYGIIDNDDTIDFAEPALNFFEILIACYAIYAIDLFCCCLSQGLLYEYQPR